MKLALNHSSAAMQKFSATQALASFAKAIEPPFAKCVDIKPFAKAIEPPFAFAKAIEPPFAAA